MSLARTNVMKARSVPCGAIMFSALAPDVPGRRTSIDGINGLSLSQIILVLFSGTLVNSLNNAGLCRCGVCVCEEAFPAPIFARGYVHDPFGHGTGGDDKHSEAGML